MEYLLFIRRERELFRETEEVLSLDLGAGHTAVYIYVTSLSSMLRPVHFTSVSESVLVAQSCSTLWLHGL